MTTERSLYMIGNAHIDPVWLWQWPEGLHEIRATLRSALERMDEYEGFVFTCDSVAYLEWAEKVEPEMFEAIKARVAQGRFVVVGGWWVEPDCNLPHGESFVRQALYSQHFLWARFGHLATVGCNVDPFGHAATLPQLLARAGLDSYMFLRPEPKEKALPGQVFWWEASDGSRVLAYRIPYGYCAPGEDLDEFVARVLDRAEPDPELMVFYGVGDHGGGPTRQNLDSIARLDAEDNGLHFYLSGPRAYFDRAAGRPDLPTHRGDLQHHAVGCYSAHSGVKRWNRRAEHLLMAAERWASVAAHLGLQPYPGAELAKAWKQVLFNQFHDTLAGTAIAPAYDDARDQYGYACALAADVLNLSAQAVAGRVAVAGVEGSQPVIVFNPLPWPVRTGVEFELEGPAGAEVDAFDEESGTAVPVQRTTSLATVGGRHRRLVLEADLPALGYRLYRLRPRAEGATAPPSSPPPRRPAKGRPLVLENDRLRVELSPVTGWTTSFLDKRSGAELAGPSPQGHAVVVDDPSDTWGHDVKAYDAEIGRFRCRSLRWVEEGPVRCVAEAESTFGGSRLVERFVLEREAGHLEVRASLEWREELRALKLRFPSSLSSPEAVFSVPYGRLGRGTTGSEEVAQAWVDVSGRAPSGARAGWSVLNDGKYAYDVRGAEIGMTAARSPVYAWHDPFELVPRQRYRHLDQGWQEFTYVVVPHAGDPDEAGVPRLADELNERPFALPEHAHPGGLPPARGFAADGGGPVVMCVVKRAEDGGGTVVRAYESTGRPTPGPVELTWAGRSVRAAFGPGEVKTFLFPDGGQYPDDARRPDGANPAAEVSLLEWPDEVVRARR